MASLDSILERYVSFANGHKDAVQAAAFVVKDKNGRNLYSKSLGKRRLGDDDSPPFTQDTVCWVASMTKLITSVCAMQMVEKGRIGLDDDVGQLMPELSNLDVLQGFDAQGQPILTKQTHAITLRHLLSHSSGLSYDIFDPDIQRLFEATGRTVRIMDDVLEGYIYPLKFQSGEGWVYSVGIDWAGRLVEILSGQTLEEYMRQNIFTPLNMTSTTLNLSAHPELAARKAQIGHRAADGTLGSSAFDISPVDRKVMGGGGGIFTTATDYAQFLSSLVSNDGKLLRPETVRLLSAPTLTDASRKQFQEMCDANLYGFMGSDFPQGTPVDHSLGGALNLVDVQGKRKKGSMMWLGLTNPHWWIDSETGIAAVLMVQILDVGDEVVTRMYDELERAVYKDLV